MSDHPAPMPDIETTCVHAGQLTPAVETPPLSPPIYQASVFRQPDLATAARSLAGDAGHYAYSRVANPTVAAMEEAVAALEDAEAAVATASGMGAIGAVLLAELRPGDILATTGALYGTTRELMDGLLTELGVDVRHLSPQAIADGLPDGTRLLYTETISNPLLRVADLPALAEAAHAVEAGLVVDSTFATPYHCRPLAHGADLVLHSATKYLGGHGDLIAGVVTGRAARVEPVRAKVRQLGVNAAPLEAWLVLRGVRTLHLRCRDTPRARSRSHAGSRAAPTCRASTTLG